MEYKKIYQQYSKLFLELNSKINLISKNDEKYLFKKHISDSLALKYFFEKYYIPKTMLDIGTGGGFPSVPIAIAYPQIKITAIDSIRKKINAVEYLKQELKLNNLTLKCIRAENLNEKFELVTSRAVSSLKNICEYGLPKIGKNGYFVAFKSKKVNDEIDEATPILKKYNAKIIDIIEYELPLEEKISRNLVVIKR